MPLHRFDLSFNTRPRATSLALRLAVRAALIGCAVLPCAYTQAADAVQQQTRAYDIAAGSLAAVLGNFAAASGVALSFDPSLVAGLQSPGLRGEHGVQSGFSTLLSGAALIAVDRGSGEFTLRRMTAEERAAARDDRVLAPVKVSATGLADLGAEGRAADGYRVKMLSSVGPLDARSLRDTPFSISVVSSELMQNIQAATSDDVYRLNPFTKISQPVVTGFTPDTIIRGFVSGDTAEDGLRRHRNHESTLPEDKERIEILGGLSGFLYGAANPGGIINYVYKRPTLERLNRVTVGNYGGSQYYVHGDFGGRIDGEGRAGYRVNAVYREGETPIDDQHFKRELLSTAFDWQVTDALLLQLHATYGTLEIDGATPFWYFAPGVEHPSAPDVDKQWGQKWARNEFEHTKLAPRFTWQINDAITLRGAYGWDKTLKGDDRDGYIDIYNFVDTPTTYAPSAFGFGQYEYQSKAGQLLADIRFATGAINHQVTTGYYMSEGRDSSKDRGIVAAFGSFPLERPTKAPRVNFAPITDADNLSARTINENFVFGDSIELSPQWTALLGINHSRIIAARYNDDGSHAQPAYDDSRNSPMVSVLYKPQDWLTAYASYIEGLQQGGIAPMQANNRNEMMAPMISRQQEIGVKAEVANTLLTAAIFRIEKALEFLDPTDLFYKQSGRQEHRGLELSATGRPLPNLSIVSGVTLLDAEVKKQANPALNGNAPINVAETMAKIYAEYDLRAVPGLTLTGGVFHTGEQYVDSLNTERLPSFTTLDIGARYLLNVSEKPVTLRLSVSNLTGKDYWLNSDYLGQPRTVAFSAQMQF